MAISANSVFEVRTTGSDSNAGGFVAGASGTDYSQQNAAQYAFTNLASANGTSASPSVTSASHNFVAADVGNLIRITAGTSWTAGWYQIVSVAANAATLDRACGSAATLTSGSYVVGGALLSPSIAASAATVAGNLAYIMAGTYSITTASTATAGGCCAFSTGTTVVGYSSNRTRSNTDTMPLLQLAAAVSAATIISGTVLATNLSLDGAANTTSRGSSANSIYRCKIANCTNAAQSGGVAVLCEFTGCSTSTVATGICVMCVGHANSVTSFSGSTVFCIAYANTATPYILGSTIAYGCVAYGNTGVSTDGFTHSTNSGAIFVNCISESNGRNGFSVSNGALMTILLNCSSFGNAAGDSLSTALSIGALSPSASVFANAAAQDFSLNSTAGAGAVLRGGGFAQWIATSVSMTSYPDVGAVQHQDAGGGLLINPGLSGGLR